jgi:hypothetical protein
MTDRQLRRLAGLPVMMAELAIASWETIAYRSWMLALGSCSSDEVERMVAEKAEAAQRSGLALLTPWDAAVAVSVVAPWHRRAKANARRLRRR